MKLYKVPRNNRIKIIGDIKVPTSSPQLIEGQELNFHHIDGMYSYCTTDSGEVVHLAAWAEVELLSTEHESKREELLSKIVEQSQKLGLYDTE